MTEKRSSAIIRNSSGAAKPQKTRPEKTKLDSKSPQNSTPKASKNARTIQTTCKPPSVAATPQKTSLVERKRDDCNPHLIQKWVVPKGSSFTDEAGIFAVGDRAMVVSLGVEVDIDSINGGHLFVVSPELGDAPVHWPFFDLKQHTPELPPESPCDDAIITAQISEIRSQGSVAPEGVWIETCKVSAHCRQAYYRARSPCFQGKSGNMTKRRYLGVVGSPAHQEAIGAIARRNEIQRLRKEMKDDSP